MAAIGVSAVVVFALNMAFFVPAMTLIAALLLGAFVIAVVRRVYRGGQGGADAGAELARYRALYEQGAISEEEYRSLRGVLGGSLRREFAGPSAAIRPADATAKPEAPGRDVPNAPAEGIRPAP